MLIGERCVGFIGYLAIGCPAFASFFLSFVFLLLIECHGCLQCTCIFDSFYFLFVGLSAGLQAHLSASCFVYCLYLTL